MTTLAIELRTTFLDDAMALFSSPARALLRVATAPIDRIANACDVGGILAERRVAFRLWRTGRAQARREPRRGLLARINPLRNLRHLT